MKINNDFIIGMIINTAKVAYFCQTVFFIENQ
jgi:hypothetical protein